MRTVSTDLPRSIFAGVAALGVTITSLDGAHVSVSGGSVAGCHFGGELPMIKDRGADDTRTAFFAVLGPSSERRAAMDDQDAARPNPYVVCVVPRYCEHEGELYVPDENVPEGAAFLVAVVCRETTGAPLVEDGRATVVYVEPRQGRS